MCVSLFNCTGDGRHIARNRSNVLFGFTVLSHARTAQRNWHLHSIQLPHLSSSSLIVMAR